MGVFKIRHNSSNIEVGDGVSIIGYLEPNYTVTPKEILVSKQRDYFLVFIRSLIALPLLIYLFHKNWQFEPTRKLFRRQ